MASLSLVKARKKIDSLQKSTRNARKKAGEVVETVVEAGETVGTAFAFGLFEGQLKDPKSFEIFTVPIPLATGLVSHAFALMGVGKGMERHMRAIGNGALAAHLNGVGRGLGKEMKTKRAQISGEAGPDALPAASRGAGMTAADLYAMAS